MNFIESFWHCLWKMIFVFWMRLIVLMHEMNNVIVANREMG